MDEDRGTVNETEQMMSTTTKPRTTPSLRYAVETECHGITMRLIGEWIDLAAYYSGSDGNAWTYSATTGGWSNGGDLESFRASFERRYRGALFA